MDTNESISKVAHDTATQMPRQKLSVTEKNEKWRKQCIDAAINLVKSYGSLRRQDHSVKQRNYDLFNGKLTKEDLEYAVNPLGIEVEGMTFPAKIQPYDTWSPIFMELMGEESRRPFSFIVAATNPEAISEKDKQRKQLCIDQLTQLITDSNPNTDPKELEAQLAQLDDQYKSYRELREVRATRFLNYLRKNLTIDIIFQKGWKDAIISAEELYSVEEISNEPRVRKINPLEIDFILPHNSDMIDEAEMIVESTYMSTSQIIDQFYEDLTEAQIKQLESQELDDFRSTQYVHDIYVHEPGITPDFLNEHNPTADSRGNKKVYKVTWKSKQKIGFLRFINPQTGEQEERQVSEFYKPVKGEAIDWRWINQYWEGWRIGGPDTGIYINIRPKKLQFRRIDNISACKSGYVGTIYNCDNSKAVSLMDRLAPFIYLYVVIWYNTELAIATNWGKIALIDMSLIPDGWEPEKWFHYARMMKIGFVNSFNIGQKGERQGKQNQSNQNRELNLETGNYIQQHISLLQYIEQKIQELAGIPRQRMGQVKASDLVGNTEHSLNQASFVTEHYFQVHNHTKKRVLETLIETAKKCWEGKTKHIQYITDDMANVFESIDMNEFIDSEFGVFVTNSSKDTETLSTLKALMQAAVQNDKVELSQVIDVLNSESISDIKSKLLKAEADRQEQQQAQIEQQNQGQLQTEQMRIEFEREKLDREDYNKERDRETDIQVAEIKAIASSTLGTGDADQDDNGVPDVLELEKLRQKSIETDKKIALEHKKLKAQSEEAEKQRKHEKEMQNKETKIKEKEIVVKKIAARKAASKPKPKK